MVDPATLVATSSAAVSALTSVVTAASQSKTLLPDAGSTTKVYSSKENLDLLTEVTARLRSRKADYYNIVARQKTKVPSETYKDWIRKVTEAENHVANLIVKYNKHMKKSPSDFDTELEFWKMKADNLIEEGHDIKDNLMVQAPPQRVITMRVPNFDKFETLQGKLGQILKLLENEEVNGITVNGTMGVGKTTILKNLNNHKKVAEMFDIVIWLKVSTEGSNENSSTKNLQETLLRRLNLKNRGKKSSENVALTISKELEDMKYLLLMDDVKQDIKLCDLGIPSNTNGSKVVLTTRHAHVCHENVNRVVKVTCLTTGEAWEMFRDVLQSPSLIENPKIGPLAWSICNKCGGLPLLIEKVASTFKFKNDECLWREGLNSWRIWPQKDCQGIIEMFNFFEICYNELDDAQKQCFLYGALYPEDSDIHKDYLLERWRAEDFLVNGRNYARGNEVLNGSSILSHLTNVSLLEESKGDKYVSMHKFIRQVALNISSKDPICLYLVKTNAALREPVDAATWCQKRYISLSRINHFNQLPDRPNGSMLSTLFLQKNLGLKEVPESFFLNMTELRVLDFCETGITWLPESLASASRLKVLCLSDCTSLAVLPSAIQELSDLEVLDIQRSGIENIPTHLEKMKGLRRLRISLPKTGDESLLVNGFRTIAKLTELEELVIHMDSIDQWPNKAVILSIIENLTKLEKFTALNFSFPDKIIDVIEVGETMFRIHVPDAEILQTFNMGSCLYKRAKHLQKFQIIIACENSKRLGVPDFYKYLKYIKYCDGQGNNLLLPELFENPDAFELVNHKTVKELSNFKVSNDLNKISAVFLGSCDEIETIFGTVGSTLWSEVEHLYLEKLPKLESIWKEPLKWVCFEKLKTLSLSGCHKLTQVFSPGVVLRLTEMQTLEIEDCWEIVEIFHESETTGLPKLKKLMILSTPKLEYICKNKSLKWPSLEEVKICKCPSIQNVPFSTIFNTAEKVKVLDLNLEPMDIDYN